MTAAEPSLVWDALTKPEQMKQWMAEPSMNLEVEVDWTVGGVIRLRAFHHAQFEARGTTVRFEPMHVVAYTQLNSISRLPDVSESYSVIRFTLTPVAEGTSLTVNVSGFPTETIHKHLAFYWRGTLNVLKRFVTQRLAVRRQEYRRL